MRRFFIDPVCVRLRRRPYSVYPPDGRWKEAFLMSIYGKRSSENLDIGFQTTF